MGDSRSALSCDDTRTIHKSDIYPTARLVEPNLNKTPPKVTSFSFTKNDDSENDRLSQKVPGDHLDTTEQAVNRVVPESNSSWSAARMRQGETNTRDRQS